jgi:hypothetical protein
MELCQGDFITNSHQELLEPIRLDAVYERIISDKEVEAKIKDLRRYAEIDKKIYTINKKSLPYFCGSTFVPKIRNTQNFVEANYFIVDLDNFDSIEDLQTVFTNLKEDERISLLFVSPSNLGLKLVFTLLNPITDTKLFSDFYKCFIRRFAEEKGIQQFIDSVTSDATRVSFYSYDKGAYFNPMPLCIDPRPYIEVQTLVLNEIEGDRVEEEKQVISKTVYCDILNKLNPKTPKKKTKFYIVPKVLEAIIEPIIAKSLVFDIRLTSVIDISYGKQIAFEHNGQKAELNVYYGKNGYSIVKSNKSYMNADLQDVVFRIVNNIVYG